MGAGSLSDYNNGMTERRFSPYSDNGGSVVAIAGEDYVVIASDTRLSGHGYAILSRDQPKLFRMSDKTVLGSTGCWCDTLTFCKVAEMRMKSYRHLHNKGMSTPAVAQMMATMLYHKRFFPYYISNILGGLDDQGRGCLYSYDPVGHMERNMYRAGGSSQKLKSVCLLFLHLLPNSVIICSAATLWNAQVSSAVGMICSGGRMNP